MPKISVAAIRINFSFNSSGILELWGRSDFDRYNIIGEENEAWVNIYNDNNTFI